MSIREELIEEAIVLVERLELFVKDATDYDPTKDVGYFFKEEDRSIIEFLLKQLGE